MVEKLRRAVELLMELLPLGVGAEVTSEPVKMDPSGT